MAYFNTSYVIFYQISFLAADCQSYISIHPMLFFICCMALRADIITEISIHPMLFFIFLH